MSYFIVIALEIFHRQFYSIQSATVYSTRKIRISLIDEINKLIYVYTSVDMINTRQVCWIIYINALYVKNLKCIAYSFINIKSIHERRPVQGEFDKKIENLIKPRSSMAFVVSQCVKNKCQWHNYIKANSHWLHN